MVDFRRSWVYLHHKTRIIQRLKRVLAHYVEKARFIDELIYEETRGKHVQSVRGVVVARNRLPVNWNMVNRWKRQRRTLENRALELRMKIRRLEGEMYGDGFDDRGERLPDHLRPRRMVTFGDNKFYR